MFSYSHSLSSRGKTKQTKNHHPKNLPLPWTVIFYLKAVVGLRVLQEVLTGLGLGQRAGEAAKQQKKFICQWICVSEQYLGEY